MLRAALLAATLATAACVAETDDRPLTLEYIQRAILIPNCATAGCHSALTQVSSLNLEDEAQALGVLIGGNLETILRGNFLLEPPDKYLTRMPPDQPLPEADIELIARFYAANAGNP
jgi:hypothetical protein